MEFHFNEFCVILTREGTVWFCLCLRLRVCIIYIIYLNIYIYNIFYMYIPHFSRALDSKPRVLKKWKFVINSPLSKTIILVVFLVFIFIVETFSWELLFFLPSAPCTSCGIRRRPVELSNNFDTATHLIVMCWFLGQPRESVESPSANLRKATDECIYIYQTTCLCCVVLTSQ